MLSAPSSMCSMYLLFDLKLSNVIEKNYTKCMKYHTLHCDNKFVFSTLSDRGKGKDPVHTVYYDLKKNFILSISLSLSQFLL